MATQEEIKVLELTNDEKAFWYCKHCENSLLDCSLSDSGCGKQEPHEIERLHALFDNSVAKIPADIRYEPLVKKVIIKTNFVDLEEDYELYTLTNELNFVISYISTCFNVEDHKKGYKVLLHLRRK